MGNEMLMLGNERDRSVFLHFKWTKSKGNEGSSRLPSFLLYFIGEKVDITANYFEFGCL